MTDTPAGSPLPGTTGTGRRDAVSVAELLARHTAPADRPAPHRHEGAGPLTGPVLSVGDLLRREGRPSAAPAPGDVPAGGTTGDWPDIDLPQPRAGATGGRYQEWPVRPASGRRRAGAVAGALVAAGSVLGAALYNGASSQDSDAQAAADGLFPGVGLPAGERPDTLPEQYLPATVALSSTMEALPATAPGASGWMDVAFPQQRTGSTGSAAGTLRAVSGGTGSGAAAAIPAPRVTSPIAGPAGTAPGSTPAPSATPGPTGTGPTGTGPTGTGPTGTGPTGTGPTGTGSPIGGLPPVQALNNPDRPSAPNLLAPVTADGPSAGGTGTGPLQRGTEAVRPLGDAVGGAVSPVARAAAPVGEAAGGLVAPVTEAARPVTRALQPVTRPVADTLEPVTTPVLGALSPVTGPVLEGTDPLTGPVLEAAEPVTSLLDTSAAGADDGAGGSAGASGSSTGDTQPLRAVTQPVGPALNTVTGPVGEVTSTVTEPVGGALGGVTGAAGSLLGGGR